MRRRCRITDVASAYAHVSHLLIILLSSFRNLYQRAQFLQPWLHFFALFYFFCYFCLLLKYRQLERLFILL